MTKENFYGMIEAFRVKRLFLFVVLLSVFVLVGTGCAPSSFTSEGTALPADWQSVGEGIERFSYSFASTTGAEIVFYRFEPKLFYFTFDHATSVKRISEWKMQDVSSTFMINGAYFHEDGLPSGFFVSNGKRIGTRQFDLDKTGIIELGSQVRLLDTSQKRLALSSFKEAAQSYPFLIRDGQIAIKTNSGLAARRSFIGLDRKGRVYFGILPYVQLSLFELAKELRALPISWEDVLNLDGGPSSGLAYASPKFSEQIDSYVAVPNVIVVKRMETR